MKRFISIALCAALLGVSLASCKKDPVPDGAVGLQSFSLTKALNSTLPEDVVGKIDASANTVSAVMKKSVTTTSFIPTFSATEYDEVSIGGMLLESGVSQCTIADGTKITVKDPVSNLTATYTIVLTPNDEKAELVSVKFTKADNSDLTEDVAPEAIASEMLVRVPAAAFQKTLKITCTAGENDEIKINGASCADGTASVDTSFPIDIVVTDAVAGTSTTYVLKVGKILSIVVKHLATYTEGTLGSTFDMEMNGDVPYIAYVRKADGDSYNRAAVVKWNGTGFETVGGTGFSADTKAASQISMTFDGSGTPYVKYAGGEASSRNTVQKLNGSTWEIVGKASFNSGNINTSYPMPIVFQEGATQPTIFFNGNAKAVTAYYRTMGMVVFNGTEWVESAVSGVPAYGTKTTSGGMYYGSVVTKYGSKVYMLSAYNQYGFYVHELTGGNTLTPIVEDYIPSGETYGLPGNFCIACDSKGTPYIFEALAKGTKMQIYKVDASGKTVSEYGPGLAITVSSLGSVTEDAAFGINPVSDMFVAVIDDPDAKVPVFKYLDENLQWQDFTVDFAKEPKSSYIIRYDSKGTGYVAFTTADGLEFFSIDYEDDIIPE